MTRHPVDTAALRVNVDTAETLIAKCLLEPKLEDRERRLRDAWYEAEEPIRQAFTFALFSRVAETTGKRPPVKVETLPDE